MNHGTVENFMLNRILLIDVTDITAFESAVSMAPLRCFAAFAHAKIFAKSGPFAKKLSLYKMVIRWLRILRRRNWNTRISFNTYLIIMHFCGLFSQR